VYRQRLTPWILASVLACAVLGAWFGHQLGDGRAGNVALISATCAVLGSFVPGAVRWLLTRLQGRRPPRHGAT
jgi:hypothetical protein